METVVRLALPRVGVHITVESPFTLWLTGTSGVGKSTPLREMEVRLASEIFQRCAVLRTRWRATNPCTLYDPCCGTAYLLTILAHLHSNQIERIIGSDVDAETLRLDRRNLSLTTIDGLNARLEEIQNMFKLYGKASHAASLDSALRIKESLAAMRPVSTQLFQADATNGAEILATIGKNSIDVVITDVPYEQLSSWRVAEGLESSGQSPLWHLQEALLPILARDSIVAIAMNKQQKASHEKYHRLDKFKVGKRQIVLLAPKDI